MLAIGLLLFVSLTEAQAIKIAAQFVAKAGLPPSATPLTANLRSYGRSPRHWEINDNGMYSLWIDESGSVLNFSNDRRTYEIIKKIHRTGKRRFTGPGPAKSYITSLAQRLGMPNTFVLGRFQYGSNFGEIVGSWHDVAHGYPGLNQTTLQLDMQDGALKAYWARRDVTYRPPKIAVKQSDAEQIAAKAYPRFAGPHSHHGGPLDPRKTKLGWALADPYVVPGPPSHVARLAYSVQFGQDRIRVDAESGKVIGATIFK